MSKVVRRKNKPKESKGFTYKDQYGLYGSKYILRPIWSPINVRVKLARMLLKFSFNGKSIDCSQTTLLCSGHVYAGHLMIKELAECFPSVESVIGMDPVGFALASSVSTMSVLSNFHPLDAVFLTEKSLSGPLRKKSVVVLLTGAANVKETLSKVKKLKSISNLKLMGVLSLINMQDGTEEALRKARVKYQTVYTKEQIITDDVDLGL